MSAMVSGTLYTYPENFRAYKALIAAKYASANVKVDPTFVFGETNKTDSFLKKFPSGKVPAFESSEGKYLQDGNAIAYYVASDELRGKNEYERAQVLQWICFAESDILPASCAWVFPILGIVQYDKKSFARSKEDVKAALTVLNAYLLTRTYLVGERISLADISVACNLLHLYTHVLEPEFRKPFPNVNRWFTTIVNQPNFREVVGEVKLCTKAAEVDPKKFQQQQHHQQQQQTPGKGSGKEKKEKKEEKQPAPKKEPKEKQPNPEEELDAADAALAAEPKSNDPFDALPKGTFNMDDFKRFYSNNEESKSIPYFWEKFDQKNYSIWFGDYKFRDELTKVFMSCNLITGMYQRLDKMRKQAFASVCLFGTDNDSSISGIWVWRGQDLAFTMSPDWQIDYESYEWKKLDPSAEETKKLVEQYFSWSGTDKDGRKFNQGKIFK